MNGLRSCRTQEQDKEISAVDDDDDNDVMSNDEKEHLEELLAMINDDKPWTATDRVDTGRCSPSPTSISFL